MPMIRTVFQPDVPREVDDHEAKQLEREGLLLPLEPPGLQAETKAATTVAATPTPQKEAGPDGGK
jgi:hypothetical protein